MTRHKHIFGREHRECSVFIHQVDSHVLSELTAIEDIPTVSIRRTLLDLCALNHWRKEHSLDHVLGRKLTDVASLWLFLEQEWLRGRRGVRRFRDLLIPRTEGRAPTDGDLEIILRKIIDRGNLPPPVHQHPIELPYATVHIDLAYPDAMLALETDGFIFHNNREAFERDRERDNDLRALGWTVYRFTWAQLRYRPEWVLNLIKTHLDHVSRQSGSDTGPERRLGVG